MKVWQFSLRSFLVTTLTAGVLSGMFAPIVSDAIQQWWHAPTVTPALTAPATEDICELWPEEELP